mmetsp:Transcript_70056/g.146074  ORF Transcript_70056/g.146074 Transcript_70056/m.146074 type:complete len:301 (-) Transcript_70056:80-982(-)|eukprot:CAMPEP_0181341426 /NCGR_PEP_ID=MMETSP1101-20121128/30406_1 /TAXON_ID=46948 /ORGANISM="Rhodomonas abbreviata, Strain Caron Lab Isolate" /LENGTH=300 /DNA_ID=CAMNT_0023452707 /DNA_START=347 /DNA_END=1249 /DNA_ORIENTATION=+
MGTEGDPLAGIIAQVDTNGQPIGVGNIHAGGFDETEDDEPPRREGLFRKFFCGCFAPLISNKDSLQNPFTGGLSIHGSKDSTNLPALLPEKCMPHKVTLILDLDETLVHSSFQPVPNPDFVIPVEVEGTVHRVFVCKRPGVDAFMRAVGELFEVVVFTASLDKYANPVLDLLDQSNSVHYRLFREACVMADGSLVKDLTRLGRDLNKIIIVDNSPTSYMLQPQNAVPISSWFDDMTDNQLNILLPWFLDVADRDDVLPPLSELRARMQPAQGFSQVPSVQSTAESWRESHYSFEEGEKEL